MKKIVKSNCDRKRIFYSTRYFLIPYSFFLLIGLVPILFYSDTAISLWINDHHSEFLDLFFKYMSNMGDGWFCGMIFLFLLLYKVRWSLTGLLAYTVTGLITQAIKHISVMPRPKLFFDSIDLNFVEGIYLYSNFSFPSGHTTSAFSLFLLLTFITPSKPLGIIYFILALLVGFSRVYLFQHFYSDIYVGSIIGAIFTFWILYLQGKIKSNDNLHWLNKSIFRK